MCIALRVLGIVQTFLLSETTDIPTGPIGEVWRTDAECIKEMVLGAESLSGNGVTETV